MLAGGDAHPCEVFLEEVIRERHARGQKSFKISTADLFGQFKDWVQQTGESTGKADTPMLFMQLLVSKVIPPLEKAKTLP